MHDPDIVAFRICWPWFQTTSLKNGDKKNGDKIRIWKDFVTVWHHDPCRGPGGDDTCGWFMRSHHGDPSVMARIVKRFQEDWDRTWTSDEGRKETYFCGLFCPNGDPHYSVVGIALNLFFAAHNEMYRVDGRTNWRKTSRWMKKHLFEILFFAENPTDSLFDSITRKFEIGCGEPHTSSERDKRIQSMASCIYGWILRADRPWYKHPRWHFWHWRFQLHWPQWIYRRQGPKI